MGAGDLNHVQLAEKCDKFSNGLYITPSVFSHHLFDNSLYQELICTSFGLENNFESMLSIWKDIFLR